MMFSKTLVSALLLVASATAFAPVAFVPASARRTSAPATSLFMSADVVAKVKEIIVSQLGVEADKVVPSATFVDDLGADSLDTVELIMAIEEEFDCEIPEEEAANISTVQEVIDFVSKL
jgi:acyl carrier protein